jgi:predicted RNA-binding Zn-ribbon protein involved in translation (DUF1610 family)
MNVSNAVKRRCRSCHNNRSETHFLSKDGSTMVHTCSVCRAASARYQFNHRQEIRAQYRMKALNAPNLECPHCHSVIRVSSVQAHSESKKCLFAQGLTAA